MKKIVVETFCGYAHVDGYAHRRGSRFYDVIKVVVMCVSNRVKNVTANANVQYGKKKESVNC